MSFPITAAQSFENGYPAQRRGCGRSFFIVHEEKAYQGDEESPTAQGRIFPVSFLRFPFRAAIGGKVIARETVKAMRRTCLQNATAVTSPAKKKVLLEKQKEGMKRMRSLGTVDVPQEAFMSVLKLDE
jgi:GTP-binding protein LepA